MVRFLFPMMYQCYFPHTLIDSESSCLENSIFEMSRQLVWTSLRTAAGFHIFQGLQDVIWCMPAWPVWTSLMWHAGNLGMETLETVRTGEKCSFMLISCGFWYSCSKRGCYVPMILLVITCVCASDFEVAPDDDLCRHCFREHSLWDVRSEIWGTTCRNVWTLDPKVKRGTHRDAIWNWDRESEKRWATCDAVVTQCKYYLTLSRFRPVAVASFDAVIPLWVVRLSPPAWRTTSIRCRWSLRLETRDSLLFWTNLRNVKLRTSENPRRNWRGRHPDPLALSCCVRKQNKAELWSDSWNMFIHDTWKIMNHDQKSYDIKQQTRSDCKSDCKSKFGWKLKPFTVVFHRFKTRGRPGAGVGACGLRAPSRGLAVRARLCRRSQGPEMTRDHIVLSHCSVTFLSAHLSVSISFFLHSQFGRNIEFEWVRMSFRFVRFLLFQAFCEVESSTCFASTVLSGCGLEEPCWPLDVDCIMAPWREREKSLDRLERHLQTLLKTLLGEEFCTRFCGVFFGSHERDYCLTQLSPVWNVKWFPVVSFHESCFASRFSRMPRIAWESGQEAPALFAVRPGVPGDPSATPQGPLGEGGEGVECWMCLVCLVELSSANALLMLNALSHTCFNVLCGREVAPLSDVLEEKLPWITWQLHVNTLSCRVLCVAFGVWGGFPVAMLETILINLPLCSIRVHFESMYTLCTTVNFGVVSSLSTVNWMNT